MPCPTGESLEPLGAAVRTRRAIREWFKQSSPIPIGFSPDHSLHLPPPMARSRTVRRRPALADHPFEAVFLGHAEQRMAIIEGFGVQQHRAVESAHKGLQPALACFR